MRTLLVVLAPALMAAAIAGPATARDRNKVPEATPAGKAESCIALNRIRQSHVRSDSVIDFEMQGGKIYRNTLPQSCPGLGFEESFSYKTSLNQLCSVDIITVLRSPPTIQGPSCGLGQFQPVTLAKKAKR